MLATEAHYHMGEYTEAEKCVERVLKWTPRDPTGTSTGHR